jgi:hypothetical protein
MASQKNTGSRQSTGAEFSTKVGAERPGHGGDATRRLTLRTAEVTG